MSKEFEEIVLNKLEALDNKTTNTDNLIQKVILNKLEKLDTIETEVKETKRGLQSLTKKVEDNTLRLGKLEMEVKDTGEVVNYLNQRFTKFDYEINKKIDTLFDAYKVNKEKDSFHEKRNCFFK